MHESKSDPISAEGAFFSSGYIAADEKVKLRVLQWHPDRAVTQKPVVFVAGWVSDVSGWADLLRAMTIKMPVYYIETREKISAIIDIKRIKPADFNIQRIGQDLINVCTALPIRMKDALVMGSSFGATGLLEALKKDQMSARGAFFVGPNSEFKAHPLLQNLLYLPADTFHVMKYFVLWYLRTFRVNAKKEPEQMHRYNVTVKSAHPQRLKMSVKAAMDYKVWDDLETVSIPVALAYAPTDTLHPHDNILRMADMLPAGEVITCPTNRYMHSADLMDNIERFTERIKNEQK